MDMRIIFLACLCVVAKVHAKNVGEACTDDTDCTTTAPAVANSRCDTTASPNVCVCSDGYVKLADNSACKAKIDTTCSGSGAANCIEHAECTTSTCSCMAGYKASDDKNMCNAIYDMTCTNDAGCTGLDGSECKDVSGAKKCQCKSGYSYTAPACNKKLNAVCTQNSDCSDVVMYSECTGSPKLCKCMNGYKANADTTACEQVYNTLTCTTDTQCSDVLKYGKCGTVDPKKCMCDATKAVMQSNICKLKADGDCNTGGVTGDICPSNAACTSNKCKCSKNYEKDDDTNLCKETNGSGMAVASVLLIVTALATVLLR